MNNPFYLVYFLVLLLSFITGWSCRKGMSRAFVLILIQVSLALTVEILSKTLMKRNNAILFNFYILAEVWLCGIALSNMLPGRRGGVFGRALIAASLIWIGNTCLMGVFNFANYSYLLNGLLLGAACIIVVIQNLMKGIFPFEKRSVAYLLTGFAAYYFCAVPLFSFLTGGRNGFISKPVAVQLFSINLLLAAVKYAFVSFAFIQHKKEQSQKSLS